MRTCSFNHKEVVYDDCKYNCPLCDTCEKLISLRLHIEKIEARMIELRQQNILLKQEVTPEGITMFLKKSNHEI